MADTAVEMVSRLALSTASPFPGLRPYEEEDANWFFGRGGEINELLKRLRRLHVLAIVGASGSGKSSLVRAGVLPQIRDGYLDAEWTIAAFRPGERPIANLAEAVCQNDSRLPEFVSTLRSGSLGLVRAVASEERSRDRKVLILVDQFEELFQFAQRTGDSAQEEVKEFLKLLLAAAASDDVDVYVVLTMRIEWLNECASYPGLAEAINEGVYLVPQMSRRQFQQAILGPLESAGGNITTALLGRMLNDLDNKTDQLPVLQHALMRIWERTGSTDAFDTRDYNAVGTFSNCLSAHAEEVYAELDERQKTIAELLFRSITQVYQNRKVRKPQRIGEICRTTLISEAELRPVIHAFSKGGRSFLVTTKGPLTEASVVDVSHEALLRQWVRLCAWVEDEADKQSRVSRLEMDAAEWGRDRKRFKGNLYRGYRLLRAEELRSAIEASGTSSTALAFLNESVRTRTRQKVTRRGSIAFATIILVGFAFALYRVRAQAAIAVETARAEAASQQAKKAQEFQQDLVRKIDAAKGSPTALAEIARDIQAARVYVQYVGGDAQLARSVQEQLQKQGYAVPGTEQVNAARTPSQTQVRFFHAEDRPDALKLAGSLRPLVGGNVTVQASPNPKDVVPSGQFEVWLVPSAAPLPAPAGPVIAAARDTAASPVFTPAPVPQPQISANVSPEQVPAGHAVTLSWLTANASEVQIEGIGTEGPRGSLSLTPHQTTTYRLTAKGEGGATAITTISAEVITAAVTAVVAPPTAAPTTPEAAVDPTVSEVRGIKAALTRYREAYESESLDDVLKAWPSVSRGDQKNMKAVFDQFNAIRLSLNCRDEDIHVEGGSASAVCHQTFTYTQHGKKLPEQASSNTFKLKKQSNVWVVDRVQ